MNDLATAFGKYAFRSRYVGDNSRRTPDGRTTTGSKFAPMQLERRILLALLPFVAFAFIGVAISSHVAGAATWAEKYVVGPIGPLMLVAFLWALKCRPDQLWKPRTVLLMLMCGYVSLRYAIGLWITAFEGHSTAVMRDMFPPMAIGSLFLVFLIPGNRGAALALIYYAVNAAMLGVFLIASPIQLDPHIREDLILAYLVGHFIVVVMASVFARLRVAYGRTLARAEDMEAMAMEDALTGILNRRAFSIAFKRARARSHRKNTPVSALRIDIDHFKRINDELGHDVGDHALRALAGLLLTDLRNTDEVFRCGGEEFLILLEETPLQPAWEIAERLRRKIKQSGLLHDRTVTVSIGVAELGEFEGEMDLFKRADIALYEAKNRGRDQACLATPPRGTGTESLN